MTTEDRFVAPSPAWYLLLDGGVAATLALSASGRTYEAVAARVPLPPRRTIQAIAAGTAVVHVAEAAYAFRAARAAGLTRSAPTWALHTFVVGFPALLSLRRARAGA